METLVFKSTILLALVATSLGAQSFEGAITMNVTDARGRGMDVSYLVKDGRIRMDFSQGGPGEAGAMIFIPAERRMLVLVAEQRMYMEQTVPTPADVGARGGSGKATIERTGRTETIAGYQCEHILVTDNGKTGDVCVAKGLGTWMMPSAGGPRGGRQGANQWEGALGAEGFPLKVQEGDKVVMSVSKIEKKSLDASLFEAPAGFTKMDISGLMRRPPDGPAPAGVQR